MQVTCQVRVHLLFGQLWLGTVVRRVLLETNVQIGRLEPVNRHGHVGDRAQYDLVVEVFDQIAVQA